MPRFCGANSADGTRASARYSTRWTKRFAGRFMTASRYRPGRRAASRCLATRRIPCCRILARERTSRSKMAWRSPPCSRRRRAPGCRLCSPPTSGCAASASPRCSLARASTACASIQPTTIFACATRSSSRMPSFASSSTATTSCRPRAPRRPLPEHAGFPHHLRYTLRLLGNLCALRLGLRIALQDAERRELRRHGGRLDRLLDCGDERLARVLRNPRRRQEAEPDAEELLGMAELAQRRDVDLRYAARGGDTAERAGFEMRAERAEREHDAFDVAAAQRGDGGRGARMRNRHELRAGERVDELHAEVADRADARMSDAHAAGILLRVLNELREALVGRVAAHRQHARRARADAERHEIAHRVVRDALAVENDAKGERAVLREKYRL